MSSESCLVTVVIPVYNSAATLRRAALSALSQTIRPLEVLIVDDGSHDDSAAEAGRIAAMDERARVIALPENRGKPHAMNHAVEAARGTWIAVLDADDCYAEDRLAILIEVAERNQADMVADNQYLFDAGAGQVIGTAFAANDGGALLSRSAFIAGADPFSSFNYGMLKPVVRADFIRRVGLRYRENARLSEDFLWLVEFYAAGGRAYLVSRPLYYWTQAFGTVSRRWTETGAGPWRYDFLAARAANTETRQALLQSSDGDLIALLDRRDHALWQLHWWREFCRLRDSGDVSALLGSIARHPAMWTFAARRMFGAVRRRAIGRVARRHRVDGAVT
jgi:succinoglycan biosynthesis protein ExoO